MWNKEQQEAINTVCGAVQVIAAAGSGKSSCLKARVRHMVNDLDIDENEILVISFTNATASELKKDLEDELLFDVHPSETETLKLIVKEAMESVVELKVPLLVDGGLGNNWLES